MTLHFGHILPINVCNSKTSMFFSPVHKMSGLDFISLLVLAILYY